MHVRLSGPGYFSGIWIPFGFRACISLNGIQISELQKINMLSGIKLHATKFLLNTQNVQSSGLSTKKKKKNPAMTK